MASDGNIGKELSEWRDIIRETAVNCKLDFFEVIFEMVSDHEVNELASMGGFPTRYPHWRFGMEYDRLSKSYEYGLSKIYEMVINTDPCYAYLLKSNTMLHQKLVMAHVYGHSDFFKNNRYFHGTDRKMLDTMANNSVRVRRYQDEVGVDKVEEFFDTCLSLDNLMDYRQVGVDRSVTKQLPPSSSEEEQIHRFQTKSYMEHYVNPKEYIEEQKRDLQNKPEQKFPDKPERDILKFLLDHAPLEPWQQDCLSIVREEAYYFAPQGLTKIMNEGWATFWHSTMMTGKLLDASEVVDYACVHGGTVAVQPGGLNPYKIGLELFRYIKKRWDKGQYGREWEECSDIREKENWDRQSNEGLDKIFEVRKLYNDLTFVDTFLTEDFCREQKLFNFAYNERTKRREIQTREFEQVKQQLISQLTNFGNPLIEITDANYQNRGELLLEHKFSGTGLRLDYAQKTFRKPQRPMGTSRKCRYHCGREAKNP